jgi:hypothetical protein
MRGYLFALACVSCGGELEHHAGGEPHTIEARRSEVQAIAYCAACRMPHRVTVSVRNMVAEGKAHAEIGKAYT